MALIESGKSRCAICREVLEVGEQIRGFPHFAGRGDPLRKFSDAGVHLACFERSPDRAAVEARIEQRFGPSLEKLARREQALLADLEEHGDPSRVAAEFKELHQALVKYRADEGLKRALFMQWHAHAESSEVTGLGELDEATRLEVLRKVRARLARTDRDSCDVELRAMVGWYLREHHPPSWDLEVPQIHRDPSEPPCQLIDGTIERGSMGRYWARLCGERGPTPQRAYGSSKTKGVARPATPWTPAPHVYEEVSGRCPHCDAFAATWRKLARGFFVCASCNRSFRGKTLRS